jgi:hypothetical protein
MFPIRELIYSLHIILKIQIIMLNGKGFFHAQSNIEFLAEF